jgi:peptidoglycan/LPS O-acetylase OafA/YrhL
LFLVLFVDQSAAARYVLMPCRMDALALGGLVAILARSPSTLWPSRTQVRYGALILGAAALGVYIYAWRCNPNATNENLLMSSLGYSINAAVCACLLAMVVLWPATPLVTLLRWRPLTYTGEIAYGLYLLHAPASWVARRLVTRVFGIDLPGHSALSVPITFLAAFLLAGVSWRYLESPLVALKERFTLRAGEAHTVS